MLRLLDSGAVRRRSRAARGACVVVSDVLGAVYVPFVVGSAHVQSEWFGVLSRRRDVLEESRACRRRCKVWREMCVMFSDVVLVVWLCASFVL